MSIRFQQQERVRFQFDAADEIIPGGHDDDAPAGRSAGIERFLKRGGVLCRAVAGRAEGADIERRTLHAGASGLRNQGERNCCGINPFHGSTIVFVWGVSGTCGGNRSKRR